MFQMAENFCGACMLLHQLLFGVLKEDEHLEVNTVRYSLIKIHNVTNEFMVISVSSGFYYLLYYRLTDDPCLILYEKL